MKDFEAKFISNKPVDKYMAVCVDKDKNVVTDMHGTIPDFLTMLTFFQRSIAIQLRKDGFNDDKILGLFANSSALSLLKIGEDEI